MVTPNRAGLILKVAIFATGLAGIVAEFVLSTLATYLTGQAVFQWTIIMSLMLFSMGFGSRLSRSVTKNLLDAFVLVEFALSLLCASSAVLAYGLSSYTAHISMVIYATAILIGVLIGCEIPLVTRINEQYEELRTNIAGIMEKDYYGSLVGGLFFAFFALPHLGLSYTPVVLGSVNFLVAATLLITLRSLVARPRALMALGAAAAAMLALLAVFAQPIILYGEQRQYKDKVILALQTKFQKIVMTTWRDDYWLFINGQLQFSTFDEERYHEPLVHPVMSLSADPSRVLILGGGDGLALREVFKHPQVKSVVMVDLDPEMTRLAREFPILVDTNQGSMHDPRLTVVNMDAAAYLRDDNQRYGAIIVDLPDPDTADLNHLYAESFYRLLEKHLIAGGAMVTQAASPYFAPKAFQCIVKTMRAADLAVLPYHNQVPTMGEWGWSLGVRRSEIDDEGLKRRALSLDFQGLPTRFLNREAMQAMALFGKGVFDPGWEDRIRINTQADPILITYYRQGAWAMY